ncbi:MAG: hypothetical protein DLM64_02030 [Solirubrobacterales bacterium]|nr:MAG: hypothetical protein DLM64_02030 [Solirubrobacterales bacterium]
MSGGACGPGGGDPVGGSGSGACDPATAGAPACGVPPILTNASCSWESASRTGEDCSGAARSSSGIIARIASIASPTCAGSRSGSVPGARPVRRIPRLTSVTTCSSSTCSTRILLISSS